MSQKVPTDKASLTQLSRKELLDMAKEISAMERRLSIDGPANDDELHAWIKKHLNIDVPRTSVCDGHVAPFVFIADLYFVRSQSALLMANRGGSKTFQVAILHLLNMLYKPGIELATVGAIEIQAKRAYAHFEKLHALFGQDVVKISKISETKFKNGARLEILPGTMNSVNGPHPQVVHFDEVELADSDVFQESRNMSISGLGPNGQEYPSQDIITSTRKRGHGMMQDLINSIEEAKRENKEPPYEMYVWCIYECAKPVKNCSIANPDLAVEDQCPCANIMNGRWDNGAPRTLKDCCQGRMARSDGWIPFQDVASTFTKVSRGVWEAQQECSRPSTEGLVMPQFSRERHGIRDFDPDPANGPIFQSIDFGGTNPHGVVWLQLLKYEVQVTDFYGNAKRLKEGTLVTFDEIYKAEVGNNQIADMIVARERAWRAQYPLWRVSKRFGDIQAKAARIDLAHHDPPLVLVFLGTRDVKEHIKNCGVILDKDIFAVDLNRCDIFTEEIESWHYPRKKAGLTDDPEKPVEDFDHLMSAWRYAVDNIRVLTLADNRPFILPGFTGEHKTAQGIGGKSGTPAYLESPHTGLPRSEQWRKRLGGPPQFGPGL